jgi:Ca2+-binding RTX toxin-like protein
MVIATNLEQVSSALSATSSSLYAGDSSLSAVSSSLSFIDNSLDDTIIGTDMADTIDAGAGNDTVYAGGGNDIVSGGDGNDVLSGNSGDDIIAGGAGDDDLYAGLGNDLLYGGQGSDVYNYSSGVLGRDMIADQGDESSISSDKLILDSESKYHIGKDGTDLILIDKLDSSNELRVVDFFDTSKSNQIESFVFTKDETTKTYAEMFAQYDYLVTNTINGSDTYDTIIGSSINELIDAKNGNDIVYAGAGNDEVYGGQGNDVLSGNAGFDYLEGGRGNDELYGGEGGDTYAFGRGDGVDGIINADTDAVGTNLDTVKFMENVNSNQLWFQHVNNDLEVSIIGTADKVIVKDWYAGNQNQVDVFKTSDNKALVASNVNQLVQAMASFSPPAMGETNLSTNYQESLNTVIAANWV